jgi:DNA polymerase III delta subunit
MTNAVESGNAAEALRQLALLLDAGAAPEMVLGQLAWVVRSKLPSTAPRELRRAVDAVFRTDVDLKRSAGEPRVLLERLIVELCAGRTQRAWRIRN